MLNTIKTLINTVPGLPFTSFYADYIINVHHSNIEEEFRYLLSHNELTLEDVDKLVNSDLDRLVNYFG